jgi:acyl dehydratase
MTEQRALSVGDEIPPFRRKTGLENWNRFAAVNYEFVGIHMDDEAGKAAGMPSAFGMGNLQLSYLHSMLRGWLGDGGTIHSVSCQFRSPNLKGQTVIARGVITAVRSEGGKRIVDLEILTEDETGTKLCPGHATVVFD